MKLIIDVGNTNTKLAVVEKKYLKKDTFIPRIVKWIYHQSFQNSRKLSTFFFCGQK